jgi:hypothetical protein
MLGNDKRLEAVSDKWWIVRKRNLLTDDIFNCQAIWLLCLQSVPWEMLMVSVTARYFDLEALSEYCLSI